jgi:hypothetical protein
MRDADIINKNGNRIRPLLRIEHRLKPNQRSFDQYSAASEVLGDSRR